MCVKTQDMQKYATPQLKNPWYVHVSRVICICEKYLGMTGYLRCVVELEKKLPHGSHL
jgi:hypothetical protein